MYLQLVSIFAYSLLNIGFYDGQNALQTLVFHGVNAKIHSRCSFRDLYVCFVSHFVSSEDSKLLSYLMLDLFNFGEIVSLFSQKDQEADPLNAWMPNAEGFIYV